MFSPVKYCQGNFELFSPIFVWWAGGNTTLDLKIKMFIQGNSKLKMMIDEVNYVKQML